MRPSTSLGERLSEARKRRRMTQEQLAEAVGTSPYGELTGDIIYVRVGARVTSVETSAFRDSTG